MVSIFILENVEKRFQSKQWEEPSSLLKKSIINSHKRLEEIFWRALGHNRIIPVLLLAVSMSLALCFLHCLTSPCSSSPSRSIFLSYQGPCEETFKIWGNREESSCVQLSAHIKKHHYKAVWAPKGYLCNGRNSLEGDQIEHNRVGRW